MRGDSGTPTGVRWLVRSKAGVMLGTVRAPNRWIAAYEARVRWPHTETTVQSVVSAEIEGIEDGSREAGSDGSSTGNKGEVVCLTNGVNWFGGSSCRGRTSGSCFCQHAPARTRSKNYPRS